MKALKYSGLAIILATSFVANGQESRVILGIELGSSSLDLDPDITIGSDVPSLEEKIDNNGIGVTYLVGYRWENNLVVETNLSFASNNFLFEGTDFYETTEGKLMLGYSFQLAKHLRIVPLIGVSRWEVDLQEGLIFNPGPEQRDEFDGTDLTYKFSLEFPFNNGFALSLSYSNTNIDIGTAEMTQLGFKYEF